MRAGVWIAFALVAATIFTDGADRLLLTAAAPFGFAHVLRHRRARRLVLPGVALLVVGIWLPWPWDVVAMGAAAAYLVAVAAATWRRRGRPASG